PRSGPPSMSSRKSDIEYFNTHVAASAPAQAPDDRDLGDGAPSGVLVSAVNHGSTLTWHNVRHDRPTHVHIAPGRSGPHGTSRSSRTSWRRSTLAWPAFRRGWRSRGPR